MRATGRGGITKNEGRKFPGTSSATCPHNKSDQMKCAESNGTQVLAIKPENVIRIPHGLLGFEQYKEFVLLANPEEAPFQWLQAVGESGLAFLVISPFVVLPDYQPDVGIEDTRTLDIKEPPDAMVMTIATVRGPGHVTVNLKGPIIINRHSLIAKQVVPVNALHYNLQHPIPVTS
jgi:flagellar assembly factor FliW